MDKKSIKDIEKEYDLELDKVAKTINKEKAKLVLLQFPEGLKPYATLVVDELEMKTKAQFVIWLGSCYGACDIPNPGNIKFDLIVSFGHSKWKD